MSYKVLYDEVAYAKKMLNNEVPIYDMENKMSIKILAKWFKMQHVKELGITYQELYENRRKKKQVTDQIWHDVHNFFLKYNRDIDASFLNKMISEVNRVKIREIEHPVFITKSEKAVLDSVEDDKDRRLMFIYLVHSKFEKFNPITFNPSEVNEKSWFIVRDDNVVFKKMLGVTIGLKPKADLTQIGSFPYRMWNDDRHYIEEYKTTKRVKGSFVDVWSNEKHDWITVPEYAPTEYSRLTFVDIDDSPENVVDWITDFDNLELHYERLFGLKNIGTCEMCGKLFRKGRSNQKYCVEHRGYAKKGLKLVKCQDCGKEFYVPATNKRQVRCEECQQKRRKEAKRIAAQNRRNKEK